MTERRVAPPHLRGWEDRTLIYSLVEALEEAQDRVEAALGLWAELERRREMGL